VILSLTGSGLVKILLNLALLFPKLDSPQQPIQRFEHIVGRMQGRLCAPWVTALYRVAWLVIVAAL
jgi:hypothetical protein